MTQLSTRMGKFAEVVTYLRKSSHISHMNTISNRFFCLWEGAVTYGDCRDR